MTTSILKTYKLCYGSIEIKLMRTKIFGSTVFFTTMKDGDTEWIGPTLHNERCEISTSVYRVLLGLRYWLLQPLTETVGVTYGQASHSNN